MTKITQKRITRKRTKPHTETIRLTETEDTILSALVEYFHRKFGVKVPRSNVAYACALSGMLEVWRRIEGGEKTPLRDAAFEDDSAVIEFLFEGMCQDRDFRPILKKLKRLPAEDQSRSEQEDAIEELLALPSHPNHDVMRLYEDADVERFCLAADLQPA